MKKLNLLIAALHAGALALVGSPGLVRAQDAAEVRAYINALSVGTAEAMSGFSSSTRTRRCLAARSAPRSRAA